MVAKTHNTSDTELPKEDRWDWITPVFLAGLCMMSILFIHSAQAYDGGNEWKRQLVWCLAGFVAYFSFSLIDYRVF